MLVEIPDPEIILGVVTAFFVGFRAQRLSAYLAYAHGFQIGRGSPALNPWRI